MDNKMNGDDVLSEAETERRFKATLHKMLNTPHQPHEKAASGKRTAKRAKSQSGRAKPKSGAKPRARA